MKRHNGPTRTAVVRLFAALLAGTVLSASAATELGHTITEPGCVATKPDGTTTVGRPAIVAWAAGCGRPVSGVIADECERLADPAEHNGQIDRTDRERDTLFLLDYEQVDADGFRTVRKAYVETDRTSAAFHRLLELADPQSKINRRDFEKNLRALRRKGSAMLRHHDLCGCLTVWLPLCRARGNYYFDDLHPYPLCITDSLVVLQTMDSPWPGRLAAFERPAPNHYRFRVLFPGREAEQESTFDLYVVDPERRIAVLQEDGAAYFRLFAAAESIGRFDLLAWELTELTTGHEVMETIDFEALLRPFRLKNNE